MGDIGRIGKDQIKSLFIPQRLKGTEEIAIHKPDLMKNARRLAFSLANRRASLEISVATIKISFTSLAKEMAMAPLPVPISKT